MNNYADTIFDMLDIEPGEVFRLKSVVNSRAFPENEQFEYYITKDLQLFRVDDYGTSKPGKLMSILTGDYIIIHKDGLTSNDKVAIKYAKCCGLSFITKDAHNAVVGWSEEPQFNSISGEWECSSETVRDMMIHIPNLSLGVRSGEPTCISIR